MQVPPWDRRNRASFPDWSRVASIRLDDVHIGATDVGRFARTRYRNDAANAQSWKISMAQNLQTLPLFPQSLSEVVNVAAVPQRSPFRYPGGKTWLVPQLRRWLHSKPQPPSLFVEPFAGGGIAGLTVAFEALAEGVLLIELDPDVAAVWQTILSPRNNRLAKMIEDFDLNEEHVRRILDRRHRSTLDRAFATILRNRVQHGGIMAPGASLMRNGENGKGLASRWYAQTLAKRIRNIASVTGRLAFHLGDAFDAIHSYRETKNAVFFVDPPYTVAGRRLYRYYEIDHELLFQRLAAVVGDVLMTYDDTPEVRRWADATGFEYEKVAMKSRQHSRKTELLIGSDLSWVRDR